MPGILTIDELIASIEVEREGVENKLHRNKAEIKLTLDHVQAEGRHALSADETTRLKELRTANDQAKIDLAGVDEKLAEARAVKAEEVDTQVKARKTEPAARKPVTRESTVRVGTEERTYRPDIDRRGKQFLWDVVRGTLFNDYSANQRLAQHMHEERVDRPQYLERAVGTGAFTGLVVPQYLTDMYAPAVAALRPFADICNKHELPPDGMTVNISRITTGTSVVLQATENTAPTESAADDTLLTENVQTASGWQDVSRQAIERGTGVDDVLMDDLFRRFATALDGTLLNQATTGLSAVATAVTYDDASPTTPELYPKILGASAGSEAALLAQAFPTHAVMHSRRWYWMASQMTSTWPFINSAGVPVQAGGVAADAGYNQGIRGRLPIGLGVVVDNNIATNLGTATSQDEIYVVPSAECHLWEDPAAPVFIRAEQAAAEKLSIRMVLYGYFAYSLRRYANGMQKVAGTGLATPAF